ncbi:MAG: hypothetical protein JXO22_12710 [Phycisphaerae bacterium]|nr:hypothetical protein [Phycisphaerae bacterium]
MRAVKTQRYRTEFIYDCPRCGTRLALHAEERGDVRRCHKCGVLHPAPCFRTFHHDDLRPLLRRDQTLTCPRCGIAIEVTYRELSEPVMCQACGHALDVPSAPWDEWWRPVSRALSREDRRQSLHHLMFVNTRRHVPDRFLDARSRRRFQYFCGNCGRLYTGRVWDIATQVECAACGHLMIVPAPSRPGRRRPPVPVRVETDERALPNPIGVSSYMA